MHASASSTTVGGLLESAIALRSAAARSTDWIVRERPAGTPSSETGGFMIRVIVA
jgi:hypothetical protein